VDTFSAAQAVEALVHEYGKLVFHTIYGLTGDWEESQDLTQDTFHQALKSIEAARAKSGAQFHPKAWLLRIALNSVLMQRRRRSIFRFIPISRMQQHEQATDERLATSASTLDILRERAAAVQPTGYGITEQDDLETLVAEQDAVRRTLARVSEPLRICLVLSIIGQFSSSEIATMLGLEEATVRQRLTRARKQFQQLYRLESGEEVYDQTSGSTAVRPAPAGPESQSSHRERVESHTLADQTPHSSDGRKHAERLYRNSAVTPLR
jgi:RNA polymerase sigma factor (sigma-70 family)